MDAMDAIKICTKNATYQRFEVLKTNRNKRYKYNEFFVEGVRNINEAITNHWNIRSFIFSGDRSLSGWARNILRTVKTDINYELPSALMADISDKEDTSEILAIVEMREDDLFKLKLSESPVIALFDRPSNKGNLGTIIRSCDSFGIDALLLTGHSVDLYDPDVISASMGSFFNVPTLRVADYGTLFPYIDTLRHRYDGLQVVGTTAHNEKNITEIDFTRPALLMIGNETDGLSRTLKEKSDVLATIPMSSKSSASSFNVGCAATVFFYEVVRQRL